MVGGWEVELGGRLLYLDTVVLLGLWFVRVYCLTITLAMATVNSSRVTFPSQLAGSGQWRRRGSGDGGGLY